MKNICSALKDTALFAKIAAADLSALMPCLGARIRHYAKGQVIYLAGETVYTIGVVLSGTVQVGREDMLGNRHIIAYLGAGELFAESFACANEEKLPVTVLAAAACQILFIDYKKMITPCAGTCPYHTQLIANMLGLLAQKNIVLNQKIAYLSKRSTREKLLAYLDDQAQKANSKQFAIPFNRQELADYLCVERSAMSAALGKLRAEGLIRFTRNRFELVSGKRS